MDQDFLDELVARISAQQERDQAQAARRASRARSRSGSYGSQRGYYEVVDVPVA